MGLGGTTRSAQAFSTFSASFFGVFGIEMVSSYLFTSTFPLHGARLDFVFVCVPCGHPLLLDATALRPLSSALFQPAHTRLYSLLSLSSGEFTVVSPPIGGAAGITALPDPHAAPPGFYCASCGKDQKPGSRQMSIPSAAVAVAVCIYKGVIDHCDPAAGPIEACRSCHDAASSALCLTRFAFPSSSDFRGKKYTGKTAKERSTPIATGSGLNRGALKGVPVGVTQELNASHMGISNPPKVAPYFPVGAIVDVEPRTGLNQNKEGGRVRVTKVNGGKHGVPCAASGGGGKGLPLVPLFNPDDKNTRNQRPSSSSPSKERWGLFVVTYGVISAVVVVVAAVAGSAVSWRFRRPGALWRPPLGLSEHAEPRWCC